MRDRLSVSLGDGSLAFGPAASSSLLRGVLARAVGLRAGVLRAGFGSLEAVVVFAVGFGEREGSGRSLSFGMVHPRARGFFLVVVRGHARDRWSIPAARGLPLRADSKEMSLRFIPAARGPACVRHFSGISLEVWFSPGAEFRLAFPARVTLPCSPSTVRCTLGSSTGGLGLIRSGRCSRCSSWYVARPF